ncbi:CpaF family protein [Clostridium sp. Marseille-P2415]|uniref:CpaF family protein n=1 Tax=Clostridium sp. Marseille-P2415 TaxID=1805471 RepID=UPI003FA48456
MDDEQRRKMREEIMRELDEQQQVTDEELYTIIDRRILEYGQDSFLPLKDKIELRGRLFDSFRRLGALQVLVDDREVSEIMVNGADRIFVERNGRMEQCGKTFDSQEQLEDTIQQIVSRVNRTVNVSRPIADARLPDGSRVHVVLPPIALDGPAVTIRKFPEPITMAKLLKLGSVTEETADFLKCLVEAGYNIFISGGTNSGKSTFLNALSAYIPRDERIVTIEDSAELKIAHIPNLVRLETRGANGEGEGEITIGDLIKAALRMNPSRIIIGEVRGKEALDMISAMNTGHDGSLSTGHGNSPKDMLSRLETMVLMGADIPLPAVRSQVAAAIDILIHLGRLRDKSRRVLSIVEVVGYENGEIRLNPLYRFEEDYEDRESGKNVRGSLKKVGNLQNTEKLKTAGIEIR